MGFGEHKKWVTGKGNEVANLGKGSLWLEVTSRSPKVTKRSRKILKKKNFKKGNSKITKNTK